MEYCHLYKVSADRKAPLFNLWLGSLADMSHHSAFPPQAMEPAIMAVIWGTLRLILFISQPISPSAYCSSMTLKSYRCFFLQHFFPNSQRQDHKHSSDLPSILLQKNFHPEGPPIQEVLFAYQLPQIPAAAHLA